MSYITAILWAKLILTACRTFIFLKFVCIWSLILHAKTQSLKESRAVAMESFSIALIEAIVHKYSRKKVFSKYWKNLQETTHTEIKLQIIGCNLTNMPAVIRPKPCIRKVGHPECHMYVFCMSISCLFSSGMKLGVWKFRFLIAFGLHRSLRVSLILDLLEPG